MIRHAQHNENIENIDIIINIFYEVYSSSKSKNFAKYSDSEKINIFKYIFLIKNHYFSYDNYIVHEDEVNGQINAIALVVMHQDIDQLKINTFKILSQILKINFDLSSEIEAESKINEVYLDTLGVQSDFQSQGIGTKIIEYIASKYQRQKNISYLSLNVSFKNPKAYKLYTRAGFNENGIVTIHGEYFYHMIKSLN